MQNDMQGENASLTKLTVIYTLGNFSSKLLSFSLIFFLTNFLSKADVGNYDLINSSLFFIVPVVSLQIGFSVFRWLVDNSEDTNKEKVLSSVSVLLFINIVFFSIIYWCLYFFFCFEYAFYIFSLSILQTLMIVLQQAIRGIGKNLVFISVGIASTFLTTILSIISLYYLKAGIKGLLIANCVSSITILILILKITHFHKYLSFRFSKPLIMEMLNYSLPLLPNSFCWWLITFATRYIILYFLGAEANGIFAISYKAPALILILSDIFYLAWQEKAIKADSDWRYSSEVLRKYTQFLFSAIIMLSCLSKYILSLLVAVSFVEAWRYMPILLYATAIQAIVAFYGALYLKSKQTKGVIISSLLGALTTILLGFLLTKYFGLYGIAMATLLGFIVVLLIRIIQTKSYFPVKFPYKDVFILSVIFFLISMINYITAKGLFIPSLIASVSVFYIYNKELALDIKTKIAHYVK